jgi:D-apionolactonase
MHKLSELSGVSDSYLERGSDTLQPKMLPLKCGMLDLHYEAGKLRYIKAGDTEIVRMIYPALRDSEWYTIPPVISNEKIKAESESFLISYHATYSKGDIAFEADIIISGDPDSTLKFKFSGIATGNFMKNRIGLCVLHPLDCAGKNIQLSHPSGAVESAVFPKFISAHQPFLDLNKMEWKPSENLTAKIQFSGDVFETEDQRNWTDASFKTYSTPLSIPYPAAISKGEKIDQEVQLELFGECETIHRPGSLQPVLISIKPDLRYQMPAIGISRSTSMDKLLPEELKILKQLGFDHYRLEIHMGDPEWADKFTQGNQEAKKMSTPLLIALYFKMDPLSEAKEFIEKCFDIFPQIEEIILFKEGLKATSHELFDEVELLFREGLHHAKIGVGTNENFAEFNRNSPYPGKADFLVFSANPQVHASDDRTLIENLLALPHTIRTARHSEANQPVYVSPLNLSRFHFVPGIEMGDKGADSRQHSLFGAGWVLGAFKFLAESGTQSVTIFETTGDRGILMNLRDEQDKDSAPSNGILTFPVFFILCELLRSRGFAITSESGDPLKMNALFCKSGGGLRIFLVNHTSEKMNACFEGITGKARGLAINTEVARKLIKNSDDYAQIPKFNFTFEQGNQISLEPYGICILDMDQYS